jgi:hypothetical protein
MAPLFTGLKLGFGSGAGEKSIVTTIYTLDGSWTYLGALEPTWTTQSIPVPADTTSVKITADGGSGGPGVSGGYAGFAEATFTTLAGKTLNATIRGEIETLKKVSDNENPYDLFTRIYPTIKDMNNECIDEFIDILTNYNSSWVYQHNE